DVMRYFQKTIRRAGIKVSYSKGFSPHQIISFAAPLAMCITSDGEYFDGEFDEISTSSEMVEALNKYGVDEMKVSECVLLPEDAKNSMSVVAASDYLISFYAFDDEHAASEGKKEQAVCILNSLKTFLEQEEIIILKKTKKSEKEENIKPGILDIEIRDNSIYMLLSTGSNYNLKPELVMEALYKYADLPYNFFDFRIHRIETYMEDEQKELIPLYKAGSNF
ncbi:MAG: TIGR03936 family radical SAM-associated protein, partial [Coprococcus sp.]